MFKKVNELLNKELQSTVEKTAKLQMPNTEIGTENNNVDGISTKSMVDKEDDTLKKGLPSPEDKKIGNETHNGDKAVGSKDYEGTTIKAEVSKVTKKAIDLGSYFTPDDVTPEKIASMIAEAKVRLDVAMEKDASLASKDEVHGSLMMKLAYALEIQQSEVKAMKKEAQISKLAEELVASGVYESKKHASAWLTESSKVVGYSMLGTLTEDRIKIKKMAFSEGLEGSETEKKASIEDNALTRLLRS